MQACRYYYLLVSKFVMSRPAAVSVGIDQQWTILSDHGFLSTAFNWANLSQIYYHCLCTWHRITIECTIFGKQV